MDRIPDKIDSKFRFVLIASHRAEQLMRGASSKLDRPHPKPTRTAMEEVKRDLLAWDYGPGEVEEEPIAETEGEEVVAEPAAAESDEG